MTLIVRIRNNGKKEVPYTNGDEYFLRNPPLITTADGKVQLVAGLSKDLIERGLHAGNWLKEVAPVVGGGGGGRPDLAQAGGKSPEKVPAALDLAMKAIASRLGP